MERDRKDGRRWPAVETGEILKGYLYEPRCTTVSRIQVSGRQGADLTVRRHGRALLPINRSARHRATRPLSRSLIMTVMSADNLPLLYGGLSSYMFQTSMVSNLAGTCAAFARGCP